MIRRPHDYRDLNNDELEELFSNYLIDSWSFSKVSSFSRNEKAFEMNYIYRCPSKRSTSSIAGQAYHKALEVFFNARKEGNEMDLVELQQSAFDYVDSIKPNAWKLQKTTPTIEECKTKATKTVTTLLENFYAEKEIYDFREIIAVEKYYDKFLTINGVDIPLPCHAVVDLIAITNEGKTVLVDHKSKASFSDEKELALSIGKQAVTYYHIAETESILNIDEVWFVENKYSKNRDKSPQLSCFKMAMDKDTVRLFDALLYEPLKRMIDAVSTPDYVYLINENDNFVDKAEIHAFWGQTMMAEVEDFNIPESKKEAISRRLKKIRDSSLASIDPSVIKKFRKNASEFIQYNLNDKNMTKQEKIEHILRTLGLIVNVAFKFEGYSSDTYLLEMSAGTNLSKIFRYKLDIANALNVSNIRIKKELFIHLGKSYIAVESSKTREKTLLYDPSHLVGQKIPIGFDNLNKLIFWDLENEATPHVLICGATGSGKSVSITSTIEYARLANVDNIVIFDPKYEFMMYGGEANIEVFNEIEEIEGKMRELVKEMNALVKSGRCKKTLVVFDEFADAASASKTSKELKVYEDQVFGMYKSGLPKMKRVHVSTHKTLEENLKILLQKGRSSGFRIIAATQRASVKVITGDAKVNFPVQICFRVPKEVDSKVVLGESGAESLAGKGDGLMRSPEYMDIVRFQAFYKENEVYKEVV